MNAKYKELYQELVSRDMTSLDEDSFYNEYSTNDNKFADLYSYLESNDMTSLDPETFKSEYLTDTPVEKKNPDVTELPSEDASLERLSTTTTMPLESSQEKKCEEGFELKWSDEKQAYVCEPIIQEIGAVTVYPKGSDAYKEHATLRDKLFVLKDALSKTLDLSNGGKGEYKFNIEKLTDNDITGLKQKIKAFQEYTKDAKTQYNAYDRVLQRLRVISTDSSWNRKTIRPVKAISEEGIKSFQDALVRNTITQEEYDRNYDSWGKYFIDKRATDKDKKNIVETYGLPKDSIFYTAPEDLPNLLEDLSPTPFTPVEINGKLLDLQDPKDKKEFYNTTPTKETYTYFLDKDGKVKSELKLNKDKIKLVEQFALDNIGVDQMDLLKKINKISDIDFDNIKDPSQFLKLLLRGNKNYSFSQSGNTLTIKSYFPESEQSDGDYIQKDIDLSGLNSSTEIKNYLRETLFTKEDLEGIYNDKPEIRAESYIKNAKKILMTPERKAVINNWMEENAANIDANLYRYPTDKFDEKIKLYEKQVTEFNKEVLGGKMTEKEFNEKNSAILKASKEIRLQQNIYTDLQKTSDLMQRGQEVLETKDAKIEERGSLLGSIVKSYTSGMSNLALTGLDYSLAVANLVVGDEKFAKFMDGDYKKKIAQGSTDAEIANSAQAAMKDFAKEKYDLGWENITGTNKEYKLVGAIPQALNAIAESFGTAATGGALGKIGSTAAFFSMSYNAMEDQMRGPDFDYLSENEKKLISVPYGLVIGQMEKWGFDVATGAGKNPLFNKFANYIITKTFASLPKKAGLIELNSAIQNNVAASIAKGVIKNIGAGGSEFSVEFLQEEFEGIEKFTVNEILKNDNFNEEYFKDAPDLTTTGGWKNLIGQGVDAGQVGFWGGSITSGVSSINDKIVDIRSNNKFDIYKTLVLNNEARAGWIARIKQQESNGEIPVEDMNKKIDQINKSYSTLTKIPETLTIQSQREAFSLLQEKEIIEDEIKDKEPNLVVKETNRIKEINEALKTTSENATKEDNIEQQEGTAEGGISEYQGTSEGQQEVGVSQGGQRETTINEADSGDSTVASKVQQEEQVATYRAEEQAELLKVIPKIESYKVNGEIDKTLMPKTVLAKYNKIYDKYDNLISPLLETTGEVVIDKPIITTNTTAEVQRVKSLTPESEDGATFNIDGTKYEGVGLIVPVDSMNTTTEELTPEMVADFVAKRQKMIGDAGVVKAGIYKFPNSNQVSIDLSVVVPETSREQALEFARLAGQESLFDLATFENIKTGATGENPMSFSPEQHREISKALKEGRMPNVFGTIAETTKNLLTKENVKEVEIKQITPKNKLIVKAAKMVLNAIPGVKIYIHNNGQEMASAIESSKKQLTKEEKTGLTESSGLYVDGDIHINLESATIGTVYHEAFHALIEKNGMKSGSILLMAKGLKNIISDKGVKQRLDDFVSQYNEDEKAEEYISELGGILSEAEQELTTTKLQQFKTLINNIAKKLGLPVIFSASANAQDAADFINTMSKKLRTGEEIELNDIETNSPINTDDVTVNTKIKQSKLFKNNKYETKQPVYSPKEGKAKGFMFIADRMATGEWKGLDKKSGINIKLMGGIGYPMLKALYKKAGWAVDGGSVMGMFLNKIIKSATGIGFPVIMSKYAHVSNLTFSKIFEAEMDWLVRNKVTTKEEQLKNINDFISESLIGKKDLKEKKGIDRLSGKEKDLNPNAPLRAFAVKDEDGNYTPVTYKKIEDVYKDLENTFAARKYFMQSVIGLSSSGAPLANRKSKIEKYNFPDMVRVADETSDPRLSDIPSGTSVSAIQFNKDKAIAFSKDIENKSKLSDKHSAKAVGVDPHISYEYVVEGESLGWLEGPVDMSKSIGVDNDIKEWFDNQRNLFDEGKISEAQLRSNVSAKSRSSMPEVEIETKIKFQKNKTDKLTAPVAGNKLFNEPLKQALDIAKSYMKSIGKEYSPVEKITKLDEGLSKRISDAYDKMKDNPTDPEVKAAYEAMAKETLDQYDAITAKGYKLEINNNEPYSSSEDMINDLRDNNRMKIFSTESGFGEEPITEKQREENILLKDSGRKDANGETLLVNDVFRFVHDFFGHAKLGNSFGPIGEENAWRVHSEMYSPEAKKAMTSETRGQNSFVNFSGVNDAAFKKREKARQLRKEGKIDQANQLVGEVYDEMKFADQKIGLLPSFAVEEGAPSKIKFQKTTQETRMDSEAEAIFKKSLDRGVAWNNAIQNVIDYIQISKWYEEASDIDREQKIRDFRQSKKQKLKKAPSVDKILGTPKPSMVTVKEKTALKDQIKLEARAAREAKGDLNQKRKLLSTAIKGLVKLGKLNTKQAGIIIERVGYVNLDNQVMVDRLAEYAAKVFEKADYQDRLSRAFSFRKEIRELLKGDIQPEVVGMAKKFSKVDPSMVDDIEKYLEMAEIVKNAIKPSKVNKKDLNVSMRESMNIDSVSEFTNDAIENQEAILKEELFAVHSELVDAGVIDKSMSLSDIESIISSLKEKEDGAYYEADIRTFLSRRIDTMSAIIKDIVRYTVNTMTFENVVLTEKNRDLMSRLLNIDINNVSIKEAIFIAEAMDNFINNNITSSIEAVIEKHEGEIELENLIADKVVSSPLRKYFSNKAGQYMSEQIASMPILFEKLFVGAKKGLMVAKKMGWTALINGVNKAEKMFNTTVDVYFKQYSKTKPNGKSFNDAENVYERGMLAFLSRNVSGTAIQQAEELKRRVEVLKESVKSLLQGSSKEQKMAELYQKVYDKLNVESGDIDVINANADKINKSAVNWWINQWGTTYNDLADISLSVYNTMLSSDTSYSTDRYKLLDKANQEEIIEPKNIGAFGRDIEFLDKNKTGVLMESNRPSASKVSKANRYISLDFDINNSSSYKAALIDVNTAAAIRRIDGFINSKNFNKLIPTKEDRDIFRKRVSEYIQAAKNKRVGPSDTMHYLDQLTNFLGGIGVGKALGGIDQIVKQTLPIALSTFTNSGRLDILNPASNAWIDSLGMAISNRGQESQSTIESIDRRLDKANSGAKVVSNFIVDAQQIWLKWCLSKPDIFIAKSSFISYYKQYLSNNNQSTNIDWATHNVNQDAADYAMLMVDRQQNVSDAKMAGKIFNSQNSTTKIMRKLFLPFASFSLNQKSRMVSDIKVLGINSGASKQDKVIAARSLLSLPLEMLLYQSIGLSIRLGYLAIAKGIIGAIADDDDEEKEKLLGMEISKEIKNATKYPLRSMVTDFLSPIAIADNTVVGGVNYLLSKLSVDQDMIDEAVSKKNLMLEASGKDKMNEDEKEKFIEKYKQDHEYQLFNDEKKSYGTIGIGYDTYKELIDNMNTAYTGKYIQDYMGNKSERFLLPKDQDNIKNAVLFEAMFALGILPRDVKTVTNNIIKLSKKNSLTENQYEKYKAVEKESGKPVTDWKLELTKSKSELETTLDEIKWVEKHGGLTQQQGKEYIKLSAVVDEVSYKELQKIQSGVTADQIINSYSKK